MRPRTFTRLGLFCREEELLSLNYVSVMVKTKVLVPASPYLIGWMSSVKLEMVGSRRVKKERGTRFGEWVGKYVTVGFSLQKMAFDEAEQSA